MTQKVRIMASVIFILLATSCSMNEKNIRMKEYPLTRKEIVQKDFFGTVVEDPYRWLEDDRSEETFNWVKAQNALANNYLDKIPFRNRVNEMFHSLYDYDKYASLKVSNGYLYYQKLNGGQDQYVLYRTRMGDTLQEKVFDPNEYSDTGSVSVEDYCLSGSGRYLACLISVAGTDWGKIIILDMESELVLNDSLLNIKFGAISWKDDEGFFYSTYDIPDNKSLLSAVTSEHKLLFHKLGTTQVTDTLLFGTVQKRRYVYANVLNDTRYLAISAAESTSGREIYIKNLEIPEKDFCLVNDFQNEHTVLYIKDNKLILWTTYEAPNGRLVLVDLDRSEKSYWQDLIPETANAIEDVVVAGSSLFVNYLKDASSMVVQYDLTGNKIENVDFSDFCSVEAAGGNSKDANAYFLVQSFTLAPEILQYNFEEKHLSSILKPDIGTNIHKYKTEQVFYKSKDGTEIPMFLVYREGLKRNKMNPTLLYGYGGFNSSETPKFDIRWLAWLEMGGMLAKPNLRGGGEYGEKWHAAGTQLQKQNVFDDFIAAAEYLQAEGYTSPEKLTVFGRSNGGLLVGATMTQRPDLVKVALPVVGVMDMLRFHEFTAGAGWIADYGCADSTREMFNYLHSYSPVHNIRSGIEYPATMVATGDHDDRVVPAHSYKFIAHLQDKYKGTNPMLIRIDIQTGHGSGKPSSKYLAEIADLYSFAFFQMGEVPE